MNRYGNIWCRVYWVILVALALLMGMLYFSAYPLADDLWFSVPGYESQGVSERWSLVGEVLSRTVNTDMLRLPNMLVPVCVMLVPRWVVALLYSLLCVLCVEGWRRAVNISTQSWVCYAVICSFFILLPWYDYLLAVSYMLNYLLSSVLAVWFLYMLRSSGRSHSHFLNTGCALLAFCVGWCHEGFAMPLLCGMTLVLFMQAVTPGRRVSRIGCISWLSLLLGVAVIFSGSSFGQRSRSWWEAVSNMPLWEFMIQLSPSLLLLTVTVIVSIPLLWRKYDRPMLILLLTASLAAECVALIFYNGPRTTWPSVLYSLMALSYMVLEYRKGEIGVRGTGIVALCVLTMVGWHLICAVRSQVRLTAEYATVMSEYNSSPTGEVYVDVTRPSPDMTLLKTSVRNLNDYYSLKFISLYTMGGGLSEYPLRILPEKLRTFSAGRAQLMDGGNGRYLYDNYAIAESNVLPDADACTAEIITDGGEKLQTRYRPVKFHGCDGREYVWLMMHIQTLNPGVRVASWSVSK
ncbi:MAG: hypothetical protein K2H86_09470 [Muribaculaceae bacterium]|nr:hypothetical protein [Muribaculaceae bacterium]